MIEIMDGCDPARPAVASARRTVLKIRALRLVSWLETDKAALAFLALLFLLVVEPIVLRGHVTVPRDNRLTLLSPEGASAWPQLPFHSDVNFWYIPALNLHFKGDHAGWDATWDPHVQLGMPVYHSNGLCRAYPITYLLSFFTHDPYRLQTWLSVATVGLLAFFSFAFLRSLGLRPAAALLGTVGLALNTRSIFWFSSTLILAWATWSLGIMWLSVRFIRHPRLLTWLGLVFCGYSLIIGSRHQPVIRMLYLLVPFVLVALVANKRTRIEKARVLAMLALAAVVVAALGFPVLHDLAMRVATSTRFNSDTSDFILSGWRSFFQQPLATFWNVFVLGNPNSSDFPIRVPGLNITPFFFALLAVAFVTRALRRAWLFVSVFAFFLAMSIIQPFYFFSVKFLGFGFSKNNPIAGCYIPIFVICAYVLDSLLADRGFRRAGVRMPLLAICAATLAGIVAVLVSHELEEIHWGHFSLGILFAVGAAAFVRWRSSSLLYFIALGMVLAFSRPALLHRPLETIVRSSPLVDSIRELTSGGLRFAKFGSAGRFVPSNQEALVGLRSVHSYDSLSSVAYGRLATSLSDQGVRTYGRYFSSLDSEVKVRDDAMSYAAVSVILSDRRLPLDSWGLRTVEQGLLLYINPDPPPLAAQILDFDLFDEEVVLKGPLQAQAQKGAVEITEQRDDFWLVETQRATKTTLLFISSQFHRDWVARGEHSSLPTVRINEFYLGVVLPAGTERVELRFLPLARWSWLPLVFFAITFGYAITREIALLRGRRSGPGRRPPRTRSARIRSGRWA